MDCNNEELTRLSELIGLIYEGATDPTRWTKDISCRQFPITSVRRTASCSPHCTLPNRVDIFFSAELPRIRSTAT
ncbi:MAG: hypothetical protein HY016_01925 [Nitrosomonadales bacterium]|nr:hypothetical protein [Nitrosomonadales bacterium]